MLHKTIAFLKRARERCTSYRAGRERDIFTIAHDPETLKVSWLTLTNETGETVVEWTSVLAIFAFKRDCFGWDSIRLFFHLKNDLSIEINEEMEGWKPLVRTLPEYLEGCERFDDWFEVVAQPPFETNWTQIYHRPGLLNDQH